MSKNNIKVGDKVRFLDSVGEGIVTKVEGRTSIFVRCDDGFDIPALIDDVVVISSAQEEQYKDNEPVIEEIKQPQTMAKVEDFDDIYETEQGEKLSLYLAFVPENIHSFASSDLDLYFINDSNYFVNFNIAQQYGEQLVSKYADLIAPNEKIYLDTIKAEQTNDFELLRVQGIVYKNKPYAFKPAVDVKVKIKPMNFCKLHYFKQNDFFDEQAMIIDIVKDDMQQVDFEVTLDVIRQKEQPKKRQQARVETNEPLVVDLHIEQLVDNLAGFSPFDMLNYQLDRFESVMNENLKYKGKKIVFIHGKGDGVLRAELLKRLKKKFPRCSSQDASFQKYGYGATMITIH